MIGAALLQVIAQEANHAKIRAQDVFNTTLYTSAGGARTITNGINLAGKGGFIWERCRSHDNEYHSFIDSVRGITQYLLPESSSAEGADPSYVQSFNADGFSLQNTIAAGRTVAAYTFRIAPRFLKIITYTGTGVARTIAHGLGTVPGMIAIKKRNGATAWRVYHRSLGAGNSLEFNENASSATGAGNWNGTEPTASVFSLGTDTAVNNSGDTYVAYVFAHHPAGVIQCGSYTGSGLSSGPTITLGWEPQWLLVKRTSGGAGSWWVLDAPRGFGVGADALLSLNDLTAETPVDVMEKTPTGFVVNGTLINGSGSTYAYMAIKANT